MRRLRRLQLWLMYLVGRDILNDMRWALMDAIDNCHRCKGHRKLYLAGGTMACPHCQPWRNALDRARL